MYFMSHTTLKTIKIQKVLDNILTRFEYRLSICNKKKKDLTRMEKNNAQITVIKTTMVIN